MITSERWYDKNPDLTDWYQGDIVSGTPYPFFPTLKTSAEEASWGILRPLNQYGKTLKEALNSFPTKLIGRAAKDVPDAWALPEGEVVISASRKMNVMIVSRSCAIVNPKRKHFLVAPVVIIEELPEQQRKPEMLEDLRRNEIPHHFYLPAKSGLREAYADLLLLAPIHRTFFPNEALKTNLAARLSSVGTDALQLAMSRHFGQQFGFDYKDICPQEARYSCSNCFHLGNAVTTRIFDTQRAFGPCPTCGEDAAWIKLP